MFGDILLGMGMMASILTLLYLFLLVRPHLETIMKQNKLIAQERDIDTSNTEIWPAD